MRASILSGQVVAQLQGQGQVARAISQFCECKCLILKHPFVNFPLGSNDWRNVTELVSKLKYGIILEVVN